MLNAEFFLYSYTFFFISRSHGIDAESRAIELLAEVREQNKCLRLQVQTLRQKLSDAQGDIKVLRTNNRCSTEQPETQFAPAIHQREELIEQLEKLNIKVYSSTI